MDMLCAERFISRGVIEKMFMSTMDPPDQNSTFPNGGQISLFGHHHDVRLQVQNPVRCVI